MLNQDLLQHYASAISQRSGRVPNKEITAILLHYASRLPKECHDDYLSMVVLRVYETQRHKLDGREIRRAADATRKRLIRELKKRVTTDRQDAVASDKDRMHQRQKELLKSLNTHLTPDEAVAIKARIDGYNAKDISVLLATSERQAYRIQREALRKLRAAWDGMN